MPRVAFAAIWHQLPFEQLLALVRHAERLGYEAAYLDGDVTDVPSLGDSDVLDGWTVQTAITLETERIRIASIRLVHHWNVQRLAQAVATLERIAPGRQRMLVSVGGQPGDARAGFAFPPHAERVAWLDETVDALRALFTGEPVSRDGRHIRLNGTRVLPALAPPPTLEIGGSAPRTIEVIARHADAWNVNLPPIEDAVAAASERLEAACARSDRSPLEIERSQWIFARPEHDRGDPRTLADYRRFAPWFNAFPDDALHATFLNGGEPACRERLEGLTERLALDLPVIDVTGLGFADACHALEICAPAS
jgi:alkanesulfonate monooxygenase SsuD/methylene tetrahydromethanopterin reductase-like flavin-dependent oxidoreductase (luciferase family)